MDIRLSSIFCSFLVSSEPDCQFHLSYNSSNHKLASINCLLSTHFSNCVRYVLFVFSACCIQLQNQHKISAGLFLDSFHHARQYLLYFYLDIHFQYNLMLQAVLVLSVHFMNQKCYLKSAFLYSVLLNFKHIYLYCAPAYFLYLLKCYIFDSHNKN
jgi:hypothetical protein